MGEWAKAVRYLEFQFGLDTHGARLWSVVLDGRRRGADPMPSCNGDQTYGDLTRGATSRLK